MINILITSYNDNDLNNTIKSLIDNSFDQKKIRFRILLIDHNNIEDKLKNDINVDVYYLPKNKGVGVSRKILTQNLPKNEYVLQLDSHHRFVKNWDKILIENYEDLKNKNEKVIISTSLPPFIDEHFYSDCFTYPKIITYTKNGIPKLSCTCGKENTETGLISAHFIFGETKIFDEIKYKDYWYFFGEEILLSMYAFNFGYKVITPKQIIGWHKYNNTNIINRDLKIESKSYKFIKNEMSIIYNPKFSELIGIDFNQFKCTERKYNIHDTYDYNVIDILTPNNDKIRLYNHQNEDIVTFMTDGFFKGAILYDTINNKKKYFSLTT